MLQEEKLATVESDIIYDVYAPRSRGRLDVINPDAWQRWKVRQRSVDAQMTVMDFSYFLQAHVRHGRQPAIRQRVSANHMPAPPMRHTNMEKQGKSKRGNSPK